jgi:hypothetical protein
VGQKLLRQVAKSQQPLNVVHTFVEQKLLRQVAKSLQPLNVVVHTFVGQSHPAESAELLMNDMYSELRM